ncbi:MAG: HNH endonuclease [Methylococcales bacterium]|jgi:hypothetical protein|nr:HNH endonuclease [Methylococcales bacterium]
MKQLAPKILKLDIRGRPIAWVNWQEAATLYAREKVAWQMGQSSFTVKGGFSHLGQQTVLQIDTILTTRDYHDSHLEERVPTLVNPVLFARDRNTCLYCGQEFNKAILTRDHVTPVSKGGPDEWTNVVTACKSCNQRKANQTPAQANMKLLAVPYTPNHAEFLLLSNRTILADQMTFLRKHITHEGRIRLQ